MVTASFPWRPKPFRAITNCWSVLSPTILFAGLHRPARLGRAAARPRRSRLVGGGRSGDRQLPADCAEARCKVWPVNRNSGVNRVCLSAAGISAQIRCIMTLSNLSGHRGRIVPAAYTRSRAECRGLGAERRAWTPAAGLESCPTADDDHARHSGLAQRPIQLEAQHRGAEMNFIAGLEACAAGGAVDFVAQAVAHDPHAAVLAGLVPAVVVNAVLALGLVKHDVSVLAGDAAVYGGVIGEIDIVAA